MIDIDQISFRVGRGVATPEDIRSLVEEVQRLYGQPTPPEALAIEKAQAAQVAAEAAAVAAQKAVLAAQQEAQAAADRAAVAKYVSDIALKQAADKAAAERAASDKAAADAIVAQRQSVARALKQQLEG